jgi:hypothetical protein
MQAYSDPKRANDPHALPNVEVFYWGKEPLAESDAEPGWYWWSCFPGCWPDGDPNGPFATKEEALADAQENADDDSDDDAQAAPHVYGNGSDDPYPANRGGRS